MKNHALALLVVAGAAVAANADVFPGAGMSPPDANPVGSSNSVVVSGLGNITDLALTLNWGTITSTAASNAPNRNHSWAGDMIITLTGPAGTFTIVSRVGNTSTGAGDSSDFRGSYTFADTGADMWAAAAAATAGVAIAPGTYRTTGALSSAPTSLMAFFGGTDPNGTWTLFMSDNAGGDAGDLVSWSLSVVPTPGAAAMLGLGGLAALRRRR